MKQVRLGSVAIQQLRELRAYLLPRSAQGWTHVSKDLDSTLERIQNFSTGFPHHIQDDRFQVAIFSKYRQYSVIFAEHEIEIIAYVIWDSRQNPESLAKLFKDLP